MPPDLSPVFDSILDGLEAGDVVPYLGPGVLADVVDAETNTPIPADSHSLILALNGGRPMAPRLMWEFPRAAMDVELKRGRSAVTRFLTETYEQRPWTRAAVHDWLATVRPAYVIDVNRDTQLQDSYARTPHTLVRGSARIMGGGDFRFVIHAHDGHGYHEVAQEDVDPAVPVLFKPLGSPRPDPVYIASDADFVDYITELMGGFAIPGFLKAYRSGKRYLILGLRLTRDTERMVLSDIVFGASHPVGWALIAEPTPKEERFCARRGIEVVRADPDAFVAAARARRRPAAAAE